MSVGKWVGRAGGDKVGMEFAITYNMVRKHVFEMILEQSSKGNEGWSHAVISGNSIPGRRRGKYRDHEAAASLGCLKNHRPEAGQGPGVAEGQEMRSDRWHRARSCRTLL